MLPNIPTPIRISNISSFIRIHVITIHDYWIESLQYCKDSCDFPNTKDFIDKINTTRFYEEFYNFVSTVEGEFQPILDFDKGDYINIRTYNQWLEWWKESWLEKDEKKMSKEAYNCKICKYIKFLDDYCIKYNIYIPLTEDDKNLLDRVKCLLSKQKE